MEAGSGADVNAVDEQGLTPMAYARRAGTRAAAIRRLLAQHGGLPTPDPD